MAKFDQRNQTVTYQYNAELINFGTVGTISEFARQIDNVKSELERAQSLKGIDSNLVEQAIQAVAKISVETKLPKPDKYKIISLLETTVNIVKGAASLGELYLAITKATDVARSVF